jgi:hypothetical protein
MSNILKAASMAAVAIYSIATLTFTDASAAFASPLIADMIQPVPVQTREDAVSSTPDAAVARRADRIVRLAAGRVDDAPHASEQAGQAGHAGHACHADRRKAG